MVSLVNTEEFLLIELDDDFLTVRELFLGLSTQLDHDEFVPDNPLIKLAEIHGYWLLALAPGWEFTPESYASLRHGSIQLANGIIYASGFTIEEGALEQQ